MRYFDEAQTIVTDGAGMFAPVGSAEVQRFLAGDAEAGVPPGVIAPYARFATLQEAQDARLAELSTRRKQAERAFTFGGAPIDLDEGTQGRIGAALQGMALSNAASVRWQVARGQFQTFSQAALQALGAAAFGHVQACFENVEALSAAILAAGTIAAVEAIDLEAGWP